MFIKFGDLSALIFPPNTFPLLSCFCSETHLQEWRPSHCVCSVSSSAPLSLHELSWSFFEPLSQFTISPAANPSIDSLDSVIVGFSSWVFSEFFSLFLILYWKFQSCLSLLNILITFFLKSVSEGSHFLDPISIVFYFPGVVAMLFCFFVCLMAFLWAPDVV